MSKVCRAKESEVHESVAMMSREEGRNRPRNECSGEYISFVVDSGCTNYIVNKNQQITEPSEIEPPSTSEKKLVEAVCAPLLRS